MKNPFVHTNSKLKYIHNTPFGYDFGFSIRNGSCFNSFLFYSFLPLKCPPNFPNNFTNSLAVFMCRAVEHFPVQIEFVWKMEVVIPVYYYQCIPGGRNQFICHSDFFFFREHELMRGFRPCFDDNSDGYRFIPKWICILVFY